KDDVLRAGADQCGHPFPGGFHGGTGLLAEGVNGRRVAVLAREIGKHGVEDFRIDGSGGVVIEVNAIHGATFSIGSACGEGKRSGFADMDVTWIVSVIA